MKYQYVIGIDCGVNTGFAVWEVESQKLIECKTTMIHKAILELLKWAERPILVRVEDARLRKWIPVQKNEKWERGVREGAGSVKRDAKIIEDFLTDFDIPFELVAPKNNKTKMDAAMFKRISKWEGRTSNHARDAGMLCVGFKPLK